jgi:hypothetical protein
MCFRDAEATYMRKWGLRKETGINRRPGSLNSSSTVHWKLWMSKKQSYNEIRIRRRGKWAYRTVKGWKWRSRCWTQKINEQMASSGWYKSVNQKRSGFSLDWVGILFIRQGFDKTFCCPVRLHGMKKSSGCDTMIWWSLPSLDILENYLIEIFVKWLNSTHKWFPWLSLQIRRMRSTNSVKKW